MKKGVCILIGILILFSAISVFAVPDIPDNEWTRVDPPLVNLYPGEFETGVQWGTIISVGTDFYIPWETTPVGQRSTIYDNVFFQLVNIDDVDSNGNGGVRILPANKKTKTPYPDWRHVYGGFSHAPDVGAQGSFYLVGGSHRGAVASGDIAWKQDIATGIWSRISENTLGGQLSLTEMQYIPPYGLFHIDTSEDFRVYDTDTDKWTIIYEQSTPNPFPYGIRPQRGATSVDTSRSLMIGYSEDTLYTYDPALGSAENAVTVICTSCPPPSDAQIAYAPVADAYFVLGVTNPETWIY